VSAASDAGGPPRRLALLAAVAVPLAAVALALVTWLGWLAWSGRFREPVPGAAAGTVIAAGERPFDRGELASYRVTWRVGSGDGMTAGRAAFDASGGSGSCYFALDVGAASWAAALYDVRGRIESWTGADLLPSRQEYHLREGGRATDRTTRFDWASRTFTVGDGEPRPLPPGARDGLSAWFHVRTLPLAVGYKARLPVIEAGRTYDVSVSVDRMERIRIGRGDSEAFRLAILVAGAPDRREVARAVAWVSADARRVPLAVDLEASLGSFRVELEAYQRR